MENSPGDGDIEITGVSGIKEALPDSDYLYCEPEVHRCFSDNESGSNYHRTRGLRERETDNPC